MTPLDRVTPAVFKVNTGSGSGSGFYLSQHDVVVTNHHVVAGYRAVALESQQKDRQVARVVLVNPMLDLAFLRLAQPLELPALSFSPLRKLSNAAKISVLGYPLGLPLTVTEGIVSSTRQLVEGQFYIQTDAAVNPGNSGGPMLNRDGAIVGVTTCKFQHAENMGFALPADALLAELAAFRDAGIDSFAARCPSCEFPLLAPADYCDNCGAALDEEALFAEVPLSPLAQFVESCLRALAMDPVVARCGPEYWEFHQGSALVRIVVHHHDYLFVTSPLVKLPRQNLRELYRYLLSDPVPPFHLGIANGMVNLSYRIHLSDLHTRHSETIREHISHLAIKADELDNFLITTFGCEWASESRPN